MYFGYINAKTKINLREIPKTTTFGQTLKRGGGVVAKAEKHIKLH